MTLLLLTGVAACGTGSGAAPSRTASTASKPSNEPSRPAKHTVPPSSSTSDAAPPPYIARVVWVSLPSGRSLQVYPTANGRVTTADDGAAEAWREVLRKAPDAGTRGMRAQFECHWAFARLAEPNKASWNLEPWRPVVSAQTMYDTRCNPGGPEI